LDTLLLGIQGWGEYRELCDQAKRLAKRKGVDVFCMAGGGHRAFEKALENWQEHGSLAEQQREKEYRRWEIPFSEVKENIYTHSGLNISKRAIDIFASIESDLIEKYPDLEGYIKEASGRIEKKYLRWFVRELQKDPGDYTATKLYDYISEFKGFENRLPIKDIYQYSLESLQQEISKIKEMVAELEPQAKQLAEEYFALLGEKRQQYGRENRRRAYREARQWLDQIDPPELQQMVRKEISQIIKTRETEGREELPKTPKETAFQNSDVIYKDSRFLVVLPGTTQASQYFGQGTQWCTSAKTNNQFSNYSSRGAYLYYIIDKENQGDELSKIAWVMIKTSGRPRIAQIFNTSDLEIMESEVQDYLGDKFEPIISAINSDISKREDTKWEEILSTMGPEELKQNLDAEDGDYNRLEFVLRVFKANNNPETRKVGIDYIRPIAEKWAEQYGAEFLLYKLHEIPEFQDLARIIAEKWVEQGSSNFFRYKLHEMPEFQDLARIIAEKWVEQGSSYFFHYKLNEIPEFQDLTRIIAEKWAAQGSSDFFHYKLHEMPEFQDLARIIAEKWAAQGSSDFFHYKLHEMPEFQDLVPVAAKVSAEKGSWVFSRYKLHEIPEFQDLARITAEKWAEQGSSYFFRYKLHEIPEYKEMWNKHNPDKKVANFSLSKRADIYGDLGEIISASEVTKIYELEYKIFRLSDSARATKRVDKMKDQLDKVLGRALQSMRKIYAWWIDLHKDFMADVNIDDMEREITKTIQTLPKVCCVMLVIGFLEFDQKRSYF
jgi:hypothetical protein